MRRPIIFTLAGLTALGAAGIAFAHGSETTGGLKLTPVAASFAAAPDDGQSSRTCVGADGTYQITRGSWVGTAVSASSRLAGALSIRGELAVNQTTGVGWLSGRIRIDGNTDAPTAAGGDLRAVIADGKVIGFLSGRVRDEGQLFASVSATLGREGFTDGQIGRGSSSPAAIVLDRGPCEAVARPRPVVETRGTAAATSLTAITVARANGETLTCTVGADLAAAVARLTVGDKVFVACAYVDGSYRLVRLAKAAVSERPVIRADGKVTAISATSITISPETGEAVTCSVNADLATALARLAVDQQVSVACGLVDGSYRLLTIRAAR